MARLEAEHLAGPVDRQQRAELPDLTRQLHPREDLGQQLRRRAVHHRVGRGDDEGRMPGHGLMGRLQR